jgi:hypothetical protein
VRPPLNQAFGPNQAFGAERRFHSDKAISPQSDKLAAFVPRRGYETVKSEMASLSGLRAEFLMKRSDHRILATHTGSLPRPPDLV